MLIVNERCSAHSWPSTDSPICANSSAFFLYVASLCTAATVELRTLCNSADGNPYTNKVSFSGTNLLFNDVKHPTGQDRSINVIFLLGLAGPGNSSVHEQIRVRRLHLRDFHRSEREDELEDEFKENYMTVYAKTISGKTIRIKCGKRQIPCRKIRIENSDPSRCNLPHSPRKRAG